MGFLDFFFFLLSKNEIVDIMELRMVSGILYYTCDNNDTYLISREDLTIFGMITFSYSDR
jgi:hypothetical protein